MNSLLTENDISVAKASLIAKKKQLTWMHLDVRLHNAETKKESEKRPELVLMVNWQ